MATISEIHAKTIENLPESVREKINERGAELDLLPPDVLMKALTAAICELTERKVITKDILEEIHAGVIFYDRNHRPKKPIAVWEADSFGALKSGKTQSVKPNKVAKFSKRYYKHNDPTQSPIIDLLDPKWKEAVRSRVVLIKDVPRGYLEAAQRNLNSTLPQEKIVGAVDRLLDWEHEWLKTKKFARMYGSQDIAKNVDSPKKWQWVRPSESVCEAEELTDDDLFGEE